MPNQFARAFRASLQLSTLLGLLLIVCIWGGLTYYLSSEYEKEVHSAKVETGNLAKVLEQNLIQVISGIDRTMIQMRGDYLVNPAKLDVSRWSSAMSASRGYAVNFTVVGADGFLKSLTNASVSTAVKAREGEHIQFHAKTDKDEFFIGKPIKDNETQKWSLQFSRAIRSAGGNIVAIITASIDPHVLISFYQKLDLGHSGSILVTGMDGGVRAVHGFKKATLGETLQFNILKKHIEAAPAGSFFGSGSADGIRRYVSYRVVEGLPLVLSVGFSIEEFFADYENKYVFFSLIAGFLSFLILFALVFNVRKNLQLDLVHKKLQEASELHQQKSQQLEVVLDHIDKAILMEDEAGKIVVYNHLTPELLGVSEDFLKSQPTRRELLTRMWASGEFGPDGSLLDPGVREYLEPESSPESGLHYERVRPNGMILETKFKHLPGGGYVRAFIDITERKRAEARISHLAMHDPLTGLANRSLLKERVQVALARMERFAEGFAIFCFDLDGFKKINDTMGHAVGDQLLQEISERLRRAVRDIDTVARIGGDEFVILQASTNSQDQAIVLAERVRQTMGLPVGTKGGPVVVGTSIGIALAPRHGTNEEDLFKAADAALYRAKATGRNLFRFAPATKNPSTLPGAPSLTPALPKNEMAG